MPYAECPGCGERVRVPGPPEMGQMVRCDECPEGLLEVVSVSPLELDWAYDEEDSDDEDSDEDDES